MQKEGKERTQGQGGHSHDSSGLGATHFSTSHNVPIGRVMDRLRLELEIDVDPPLTALLL
jgi:hypothetical protein